MTLVIGFATREREFLLVLEGELALYTEFYEPVAMVAGDSMYYDANMGHAPSEFK